MKRRICWPEFDTVCLEGGCGYCGDHPYRTEAQIRARLATARQLRALDYGKGNGRWIR